MALTKNDLQNIKAIIDQSLDARISPLETDVKGLKSDVSVLKSDVSVLKSDVSVLKSDVKKLDKKMDFIANYLDAQDMKLAKKIDRIERHLRIPQN